MPCPPIADIVLCGNTMSEAEGRGNHSPRTRFGTVSPKREHTDKK